MAYFVTYLLYDQHILIKLMKFFSDFMRIMNYIGLIRRKLKFASNFTPKNKFNRKPLNYLETEGRALHL